MDDAGQVIDKRGTFRPGWPPTSHMTVRPIFRLLAVILVAVMALPGAAAGTMTVAELRSFVKSSLELKHSDPDLGAALRRVKLSEKLDDRTIETLVGEGLGPRATGALRVLQSTSAGLKAPAAAPAPAARYVAPPPPSAAELDGILSAAREYAQSYTEKLPNFVCLQLTRQYMSKPAAENWSQYGSMAAKLSYNGREDYKVIQVNNRSVNTTLDRVEGSVSSGDFATFLQQVFDPASNTKFEWEKWGRLRDHVCYVVRYAIAQPDSRWRVVYAKTQEAVPGYRGLVWIDKTERTILRISMDTTDMPDGFPVRSAAEVLDYGYVSIGGQQYLLPAAADMRMTVPGFQTKNEIEFRSYQKFGTETTFTFGDELEEPATKKAGEAKP